VNRLFTFAGIAATAGGWLRIANIFTPLLLPPAVLDALYLTTDMFLLAGIGGFWLKHRAAIGIAGTAGIAIFVAGILAIRASTFGMGSYQLGAAVALLGLGVYSIAALTRGAPPPAYAAVAWLAAFACGAAVAIGLPPAATVIVAAGAAAFFGAGFLAIGVELFPRLAWTPRQSQAPCRPSPFDKPGARG
jgi:hypothetical protein